VKYLITVEVRIRVEANHPDQASGEAMILLMGGDETPQRVWRGADVVSIQEDGQ